MKTLLAACGLALAGCATVPMNPEAAHTLGAAETAFAAHSIREGMRKAFLAAFADDGVFVRGDWTVSNTDLVNRPDPPIYLDWRPVFVVAAASGELGLSTGPSRILSKTKPDTPPSFGQYVSIWRRVDGGPWKVAVDLGISHPAPDLWDQPLSANLVAAPGGRGDADGLAGMERRFTQASLASGQKAAYAQFASPAFRFYRSGSPPPTTREASLAAPGMDDQRLSWTVDRIEVARSGDFGYARGFYANAATPAEKLGVYMRAWRMEGGEWRLLLDVINPGPKPQAPAAS
ncbi:nuclear transport factor 2 family protein [Usitatibacter palustris]|uniref:DUF4440 domain-containing protein n=1 Tax=Usitatibacter palustris TaxID=2732487 RepID=A0A6M4HBX4_9PROT|nr:nuclear transport factor 2 family protein [Usitatibacter palustris]QJR16298.1 hypothetical protein DSM104440_03127 [Usitatibacter palustris]